MCGHVQAIGNQRDRTKPETANDFRDHHCGADAYNGPGFSFVPIVRVAKKHVGMTEIINRMSVHVLFHWANRL